MKSLLRLSYALALLAASAPALRAQILWQTPKAIVDASDINTSGVYFDALQAYISAPSSTTVTNPVTGVSTKFNLYGTGTLTDGKITLSNAQGYGTDGSGSSATPYQAVLKGTSFVNVGQVGTITLGTVANPLVVGDTYEVQIWDASKLTSRGAVFTAGNSVDLNSAKYVIGTFVAGPTGMQAITFATDPLATAQGGVGEVNAIVLRDITAIPEPSVYAMMLGGFSLLAFRWRLLRKRDAAGN